MDVFFDQVQDWASPLIQELKDKGAIEKWVPRPRGSWVPRPFGSSVSPAEYCSAMHSVSVYTDASSKMGMGCIQCSISLEDEGFV